MRTFDEHQHRVRYDETEWQAMRDEFGHVLEGIQGKAGAIGTSMDGHEMGVDFIEMLPGSAFPPHVHPGDHVLSILIGEGVVTIGDKQYVVKVGDSIYIAAEQPHAVSAPSKPLTFWAFGIPHKHVAATDRMQMVS